MYIIYIIIVIKKFTTERVLKIKGVRDSYVADLATLTKILIICSMGIQTKNIYESARTNKDLNGRDNHIYIRLSSGINYMFMGESSFLQIIQE